MSSKLNAILVLVAVFGITAFSYFSYSSSSNKASKELIINIDRNQSENENKPSIISPVINPLLTVPNQLTETAKTQPAVISAPKTLTYATDVSYRVPESTQTLGMKISITEGIVTDISLNLSKSAGTSYRYQHNFEDVYRSLVIGKSLKDINLSRVGGASLTTKAFMEAIKAVQKQAL